MMYQGVLGTFFFTVTDAEVATFRDLKQQREIQFAEHKCVSGLPKVQHTGRNLDTLSLTVQLFPLTPLALTVDMRIDALRELAVLGEEVPLVLGLTYYGLFTGSSLTRPVFLSTLQALVAFGLAWLAFVPFWGNHGLWGAYLIFYAGRSFFLLRYWPRLRDAPFFRHGGAALC